MLRSDTKPATFWMASPLNFWRHNVAAGSTHDGFWFELFAHPGGRSFSRTICPVHERLGEFYNNTAHSNGIHGLRIYPMYTPLNNPCDELSGPSAQYFVNFTAFHNRANGIFGKVNGDLHHVNAQLIENGAGEFKQVAYDLVNYSWDPNLRNLLAVGSLTEPVTGKIGITCPQNEYFYVSGATFVNYGSGAIAGCADCELDQSFRQGGYTVRFDGLNFVNVSVRTHWNAPYKVMPAKLGFTV
jgi:hypothetical protein